MATRVAYLETEAIIPGGNHSTESPRTSYHNSKWAQPRSAVTDVLLAISVRTARWHSQAILAVRPMRSRGSAIQMPRFHAR